MSLANDIKNDFKHKNDFSHKELAEIKSIAKTISDGDTTITEVARYLGRNPAQTAASFGEKKVYLIMQEIREALK